MAQCKVPLDKNKPDINICILEANHPPEEQHYTYGLGWAHIRYSGPTDFNLGSTEWSKINSGFPKPD